MNPKTKKTNRTEKSKTTVRKPKPDHRTRVQKIKQATADSIREKLKATTYLNQLSDAAEEYIDIIDNIADLKAKRLSAKSAAKLIQIDSQIKIYDLQIKALKGLVDLNLRRLKFVLPELKSVELKDPDGNNPFAQLGNTIAMLTQGISNPDD